MVTDRETNWADQNKIKLKLWSAKKEIENGKKQRIKTMLVDCKSCGHCAFVDELQLILSQHPDWS